MADAVPWNWERYRDALLRLARAHTHGQSQYDAEALVQQTIVRALEHLDECCLTTDAGRMAWLSAILFNEWLQAVRRARPAISIDETTVRIEHLLVGPQTDPVVKAQRNEQLDLLAQGIEQLTPTQRLVLTRCDLCGEKQSDVAKELGISGAAITQTLVRARRALRTFLESSSGSVRA